MFYTLCIIISDKGNYRKTVAVSPLSFLKRAQPSNLKLRSDIMEYATIITLVLIAVIILSIKNKNKYRGPRKA
mgnify:CR=1 FL=1